MPVSASEDSFPLKPLENPKRPSNLNPMYKPLQVLEPWYHIQHQDQSMMIASIHEAIINQADQYTTLAVTLTQTASDGVAVSKDILSLCTSLLDRQFSTSCLQSLRVKAGLAYRQNWDTCEQLRRLPEAFSEIASRVVYDTVKRASSANSAPETDIYLPSPVSVEELRTGNFSGTRPLTVKKAADVRQLLKEIQSDIHKFIRLVERIVDWWDWLHQSLKEVPMEPAAQPLDPSVEKRILVLQERWMEILDHFEKGGIEVQLVHQGFISFSTVTVRSSSASTSTPETNVVISSSNSNSSPPPPTLSLAPEGIHPDNITSPERDGQVHGSAISVSEASLQSESQPKELEVEIYSCSSTTLKRRRSQNIDASPPEGSSSCSIDNALGISSSALKVLDWAANFAPLPYLKTAASICLRIVQYLQTARRNIEGMKSVAEEASDFVAIVLQFYKSQEDEKRNMTNLNNNLEPFVHIMKEIEEFSKRKYGEGGFKGKIKQFLNAGGDACAIQGYRDRMRSALDKFYFQSNIEIRAQLVRIAEEQKDIHVILGQSRVK